MSQILSTTTDIHSVTHNVNVNTNTIQTNLLDKRILNLLYSIPPRWHRLVHIHVFQIHIRWTYSRSMFYVSTINGDTLKCKHKLHVIVFLQSAPDQVESETNCYVINHLIWHSHVFYCFVWNMFDPMNYYLTPPHFIEVLVPIQENELSCICVLGVSI